jgi:hypothetical protein
MAITYGVTGGFSVQTSKTFEKLLVADKNGVTTTIISKYVRTETTTETVGTTFGGYAIGSDDVLNATLTAQVDEQLIESGTASTAPPSVRFYNPRVEASATILGAFTASTFQLAGISFTTLSAEKSETSGDVVKTSLRGTAINTAALDGSTLTTGNHSSGSTIRVELRISNTDYVRKTVTAVDFSGT